MSTNTSGRDVHIIHFSTVNPPFITRIFHRECLTSIDQGYRVSVWAPGAPEETVQGVEMHPVPQFSNRFFRITLSPLWMLVTMIRHRADIYQLHDPELLPVGILLALIGRRVIYDAHEWVTADVSSKPYLHPTVAKALAFGVGLLERLMARVGAAVIAATPKIAEQFHHGDVTVVFNYPDLAELENDRSDLASYLARPPHGGFVGGVNLERCADVMFEAAVLAQARRPDFALRIGGRIDDATPPDGTTAIRYHGELTRPQVAALLAEVRFGVCLFRPLPNVIDALPTKFFEYAAAGLPVVVGRGTKELDRITREVGCGVVVDEGDPAAVAEAFLQLVDDPTEAAAMGARGQVAMREQYNWETQVPVLTGVYERVMERRR